MYSKCVCLHVIYMYIYISVCIHEHLRWSGNLMIVPQSCAFVGSKSHSTAKLQPCQRFSWDTIEIHLGKLTWRFGRLSSFSIRWYLRFHATFPGLLQTICLLTLKTDIIWGTSVSKTASEKSLPKNMRVHRGFTTTGTSFAEPMGISELGHHCFGTLENITSGFFRTNTFLGVEKMNSIQ